MLTTSSRRLPRRQESPMVKIALDPAMYHPELSVADEVRKAAELGYSFMELSPRADWFFWHRYPKADRDAIAEVRKARIHQHREIGHGEVAWEEFFSTLRELEFDGIATVCVFGWEEDADAIHRRMLERVTAELGS